MPNCDYFMESEDEILRLEWKTEGKKVEEQARWAGLKPGMRVADIGCGPGKTTHQLHLISQPGEALGVDNSESRISFARANYKSPGLDFVCHDFCSDLSDLGLFDFIWARFVLEYYGTSADLIVANLAKILRPGGILCLIDLDYNCLSHHGMPPRLEGTLFTLLKSLQAVTPFDPYTGRKLYSYLFDLGLSDIDVRMEPHHLIFGELNQKDAFNWRKKLEIAIKKSGYAFPEYKGGSAEFLSEFTDFFNNPRRFTYTPVILCRGRKTL